MVDVSLNMNLWAALSTAFVCVGLTIIVLAWFAMRRGDDDSR